MKKTIAFLLLFSTVAFAQKNLVVNGSFDSSTDNWRGDATLSPYIKKTGANSGMIVQYVGSEWKGIDQIINIPKNTAAIEISAWIKADAIEEQADKYNAGLMTVEVTGAGGKNIAYENIALVVGTTDWTAYKKTIVIPQDARQFRIMLALGKTNGTLFFDDVKATAVSTEDYQKIQEAENAARAPKVITAVNAPSLKIFDNGGFENGLASWRGSAAVTAAAKKEGNAGLSVTSGNNEWTGIDQIADVPEGIVAIEFSAWLKSDAIVQGKDPWNNGLFNVEFTSNGSTKTGNDENIAFVTGTTGWKQYTKIIPLPAGTKQYRIMLAVGFATGTLYADDVSVKMLTQAEWEAIKK